MKISKKQCAIINSIIKPYKITTNFLSPKLVLTLNHYVKYFGRRRYVLIQSLRENEHNYFLSLKFNCLVTRGGFAKKRRARFWNFHGIPAQTKYGRKCQRKMVKKKRKRAKKRKQQKKKSANKVEKSHDEKTEQVGWQQHKNKCDDTSKYLEKTEAILSNHLKENTDAENRNTNQNNAKNIFEKSAIDDNIWEKALEQVVAVVTDSDAYDSLSKQNKILPGDI